MLDTADKALITWRIGDLKVNPGTREVWRGGQLIKLPKLSHRLLLVLAEAAPNILSHDEISEKVWTGRVVSPETITQRIRLLRRSLDDDAQNPRYIGGVRGVGYRLLVEVRRDAAENGTADASRVTSNKVSRRLVFVLLLLIGTVTALWWIQRLKVPQSAGLPEDAVAVLPFVNASDDPDNDYLSSGLADDLRDQLGRVAGIKVSARASSRVFQSQLADARDIAGRLGVRWLVEGTVWQEAGNMSISIQIIDGESGFSVLSKRFDRESVSLIEVHRDMTQAVVSQVLDTEVSANSELVPLSVDVSAYELLLLARNLELEVRDQAPRIDLETLDRAIELYREATLVDPNSALAFSRLGGALLYRGMVSEAEQPIRRAIRLDSKLSEVQYNLGLYLWVRQDSRAGEAFQAAVDANPSNVDALWELAKWQWHQNLVDEPEALFQRGLALDPMSLSRYTDLGNFYGIMGKRSQALEVAQRLEKLFSSPAKYSALARIHEVAGELDEAIAWAMLGWQAQRDRPDASWQVAELYARIGDTDAARQFEPVPGVGQLFYTRRYPELIDLGEELMLEYPGDLKLYYLVAFAQNVMGRHEQAVYLLQHAGLPDSALAQTRKADATEALVTMSGALSEMGDSAEMERYANWLVNRFQIMLDSGGEQAWWPNLYQACSLSMLGERVQALERLQRIVVSPGLAWYPVLKDAPCFRRLEQEDAYHEILAAMEKRMADMRARVPAALARHGIEMPVPGH